MKLPPNLGQVSAPMQPEGPCYILSLPKTLKLFGYSCVYLYACTFTYCTGLCLSMHKQICMPIDIQLHMHVYGIHVCMWLCLYIQFGMRECLWTYECTSGFECICTWAQSMCMLWTSACCGQMNVYGYMCICARQCVYVYTLVCSLECPCVCPWACECCSCG